MQTADEIFDFLQNKTIKDIGADHYDNKNYLVILLSCGSYAFISAGDNDGSLYLAIEKNVIN